MDEHVPAAIAFLTQALEHANSLSALFAQCAEACRDVPQNLQGVHDATVEMQGLIIAAIGAGDGTSGQLMVGALVDCAEESGTAQTQLVEAVGTFDHESSRMSGLAETLGEKIRQLQAAQAAGQ